MKEFWESYEIVKNNYYSDHHLKAISNIIDFYYRSFPLTQNKSF